MVLLLTVFVFTSCKDESIEVPQNTLESVAVKKTMTALKTHFNEDGSLNQEQNPTNNIIFDFCFDFVYPITLSYNTGTEVEVQDLDGLIAILIATTDSLYINGISFPFQVEVFNQDTGAFEIITVRDEASFSSLVEDCTINNDEDCVCTDAYNPVCVESQTPNGETIIIEFPNICLAECEGFTQQDIVDCDYDNPPIGATDNCFEYIYPLTITYYDVDYPNGNTITVNNDNELELIIFRSYGVSFVFPFNVQIGNEQITVNNAEDFTNLMDSCIEDCNCPTNYDPVCVATPNGGDIIEYDNECLAICDGFTPNNFVDCDNNGGDCEISNVTVQVNDCNDNRTYSIVLDFDVVNPSADEFMVTFDNGTVVNNLSISDLPITLNNISPNDTGMDNLQIMFNNSNCVGTANWSSPDCSTSNGDGCWEFVYPIEITAGDQNITINSDEEFDAQYNSATSSLIYPFDVTMDNETINIQTPNYFYEIGGFDNRCD